MTKLSLMALTLLLSMNTYASKSRMLALGEPADEGSYYIDDDRNIFHNVAHINSYKNFAIFEWGDAGSLDLDANTTPKAMGGMIKSMGSSTIGIYLGNESNTVSLLRLAADPLSGNAQTATRVLPEAQNVVDIMWGQNFSGVDVGIGLVGTTSEEESDSSGTALETQEQSVYALRLGALTKTWEYFGVIGLANDSENRNVTSLPKFEADLGLHLGGNYTSGKHTYFISYKNISWEQSTTSGATTTTLDGDYSEIEIGMGTREKISDSVTAFAKASYITQEAEISHSSGDILGSFSKIPLVIGVEGKAASWLTLRGSLTQALYGSRENKNWSNLPAATITGAIAGAVVNTPFEAEFGSEGEGSIENSTNIAAGATLHFGDLHIDGLVSNTPFSRAGDTETESGVLSTDNLLTRVAVHYSF